MKLIHICAIIALGLFATDAKAGPTLDAIRTKGSLRCGVHTGLAGFAMADGQGRWSGMFVDYCRALAAAVLGNAEKVQYVPLSAQARFTALQSGEVDVLAWNTTRTLSRDASLGAHFSGIWFYDGQAFMVPAKLGVKTAKDLKGATICIQAGTTHEPNTADYFRSKGLTFRPIVFEDNEATTGAFFSGRCDVLTLDASALSSVRLIRAQNPADYAILPDMISSEPLGPMVRRGDDEWFAVTKWVLYALVNAEQKGVTQANATELRANSKDPDVQRLLGTNGGMGERLKLDNDWAFCAIASVGNYGEIFARNVGPGSALKLGRGQNKLWTEGGLMFAPPLR